ncbi:MAG: sn-glycerol-3-phosphate ABC transporter permease UgpE [Alphaproteobacteria bacterium]|jgi:sn-glycerol 3-phosphate transport system permease protein|nr:sn-glycerol-3-phosphate ABC transporter permease UgpE [Alphaproteobacteria bacterium]
MVENRPFLTWLAHGVLILGILIVAFPIWITLVASSHTTQDIANGTMGLWLGDRFWENYRGALASGSGAVSGATPVWFMLWNSTVMALVITVGKIVISMLSAFAIVYFRFPFRMAFFWMIFITLMLPVEVRILPTYEVVANLNMLDSYAGLTIPLIASATATFLFRQFFLTVPDELTEAARMDGAGPMRFFKDFLLPLSKTNIAALFVILFIYGWNQYLWPLLITDDLETVVIGIYRMINVGDAQIEWNIVMATTMLAMIPPVLVVLVMQRWFVKGLVDSEK